jgi:hypothetical protein
MKKFSLKWKLFLIGCYLQLIIVGIALFFIIVGLSDNSFTGDTFIPAIIISSFVIICLNSFLNILAMHRYFPDIPIPPTSRNFMIIAGVLNAIVLAFLLFVGIIGLQTPAEEGTRPRTTLFMIGYFVLWTIGIFTQVLQFQLFSFLNKKEKDKIESLIDSLGNNDELYPDQK